jgi:Pin2-interacting protein X1
VLLKDDTLGLGAKRGETAETFALGAFEGLLGRLNGKGTEEVEREERKRGDRVLRVFQAGRWGAVAFVRGGFLVGEKIEKRVGKGAGEGGDVELAEEGGSEEGRKRKRGEEDEDAATTDSQQPRLKRKRRSADLKAAAAAAAAAGTAEDEEEEGSAKAKSKSKSKSKDKDKRKRKREAAEEEPSQPTFSDEKADKKRRKAEKRALKEAKKLEKAQRRAEKSGTVSSTTTVAPSRQSTPSSSDAAEKSQKQEAAVPTSKPALSFAGGRHAVRQRYIRQKKMASMDPQALREVRTNRSLRF